VTVDATHPGPVGLETGDPDWQAKMLSLSFAIGLALLLGQQDRDAPPDARPSAARRPMATPLIVDRPRIEMPRALMRRVNRRR
jgi:hypothetical protein